MSDPALAVLESFVAEAERLASATTETHRWAEDPVAYAREVLGVELTDTQAEILRAAATKRRVAVRSGHKVGKSRSAVVLALWWVATRPRGRVIMTSAGDRQVRSILWRELRLVHQHKRQPLGESRLNDLPALGMQWPDGREILGFTSKDAETMAGFSGDEILFIVDEASGVPSNIFAAIEGNIAGGGRIVMYSNPTRTSGEFYEAFRSPLWTTFVVSSEDTPNVRERSVVVRGLATWEWVLDMRAKCGANYRTHPLYQVRVLGQFPSQASNAVVAVDLVEAARERWASAPDEGPLSLGVDVARFGDDDSVVAPRRGRKLYPLTTYSGLDTVAVAREVMQVVRSMRRDGEVPRVKVDTIGVGGGVADNLRPHAEAGEIELVEVNSSEVSDEPDEFPNLRSQMAFALADWLADDAALPDDVDLHAELVAPTYSIDARGRRVVESKDSIKKRLTPQRSPDRADAVALAVYEGGNLVRIRAPRPRPNRWGGAGRGYG